MQSPWKLLALVEAIALVALFVLWPAAAPSADSITADSPVGSLSPTAATLDEDRGNFVAPIADAAPIERRELPRPAFGTSGTTDPLGIVLTGHVSDDTGAPVENAGLFLTMPEGNQVRAVTDAAGNFAFTGLLPGTYPLKWIVVGYVTEPNEVSLPNAPAIQRRDFVLPRAQTYLVKLETSEGRELIDWLTGELGMDNYLRRCITVLPTPEPLAALRPTAMNSPRNGFGYFQQRGIGARDEAPDGFTGRLSLAAPLPMYATALFRDRVLGAVRLEDSPEPIVLLVDEQLILQSMCKISARIVDDATGLPIAKAPLIANPQFGGRPALSDKNGRVELEQILSGITRIQVWKAGYARYVDEVQLASGSDLDLGDLRLRPTAELVVRAFLPDGTPAADALLAYYLPDNESSLGSSGLNKFRLESDGTVTLEGVPTGNLAVVAMETAATARTVHLLTVPPEGAVLDLRLEPGVQTTIDFGTEWFDDYRYTLRDSTGAPVGPRLRSGLSSLLLLAGKYRIDVTHADGELVASKDFTVGSTPVTIDWQLP